MSDTATMVAVLVAGAAVTMVAVSMYTSTVPQLGTQKESQKDSWWSQWHLTGSVFDNVFSSISYLELVEKSCQCMISCLLDYG